MALAAAGLLGSISSVYAQSQDGQPPAPPPPGQPQPPPPGQPPPADFGVAPAALPSAPLGPAQPPPPVSFGNQPPPPPAAPPPEQKKEWKRPPFYRLTRFNWTTSATTKTLGVGKDFVGHEDDQVLMDFNLNLRFFLWETPKDQLFVNSRLDWQVELTNADLTNSRQEVQLNDLPVLFTYWRKVWDPADKSGSIQIGPRLGSIFPTGSISREQGRYFSSIVGASSVFFLPLAGSKSDWFSSIIGFAIVDYQHLFARSFQSTNGGTPTKIPRRFAGAGTSFSDVMGLGSLAMDQVNLTAGYFILITDDLSFNNTWAYSIPFQHKWQGGCIDVGVANEPCTNIPTSTTAATITPITSFDVGLSYTFFNYVRLDAGYNNTTRQIGEDGKRRNVFYSPAATFYANVAVYTDSIIGAIQAKVSGKGGAQGARIGKVTSKDRFGF